MYRKPVSSYLRNYAVIQSSFRFLEIWKNIFFMLVKTFFCSKEFLRCCKSSHSYIDYRLKVKRTLKYFMMECTELIESNELWRNFKEKFELSFASRLKYFIFNELGITMILNFLRNFWDFLKSELKV